ncbi:MAG: hypothetical protein MJA30_19905, partial [Cytophagales bacterium]|nr:hypothetical protein [Cytophagales bacterium]
LCIWRFIVDLSLPTDSFSNIHIFVFEHEGQAHVSPAVLPGMTMKSRPKPLDSSGEASSVEQQQCEDTNKSNDGRSSKESNAFKSYLVCLHTPIRLANSFPINPL